MRPPLLILVVSLFVACGDAHPRDDSRSTAATTVVVESITEVSPADPDSTAAEVVATTASPTPTTTLTPAVQDVDRSAASNGGLRESIGVSDSVTIIVSDPSD